MTRPSPALAALERTTGAPLPAELAGLPEDRLAALEAHLSAALHRRRTALEEAGHNALRLVPALLRPAVRKAIGL